MSQAYFIAVWNQPRFSKLATLESHGLWSVVYSIIRTAIDGCQVMAAWPYIPLCLTRLTSSACMWQSRLAAFIAQTMAELPGALKIGASALCLCPTSTLNSGNAYTR